MGRGRKPLFQVVEPIIPGTRPEPPDGELDPEQQAIWRDITGSMPVAWFTPDVQPLLVQLCRHIAYARLAAGEINVVRQQMGALERWSAEHTKCWVRLSRLLRTHCMQSERISQLGTKLRMTNQARYHPRNAEQVKRTTPAFAKPWEGY